LEVRIYCADIDGLSGYFYTGLGGVLKTGSSEAGYEEIFGFG
jgi:hypothetical protein